MENFTNTLNYENSIENIENDKLQFTFPPEIIKTIDKKCYIHKIEYVEEHFVLPSGKVHYNICPMCQDFINKQKLCINEVNKK